MTASSDKSPPRVPPSPPVDGSGVIAPVGAKPARQHFDAHDELRTGPGVTPSPLSRAHAPEKRRGDLEDRIGPAAVKQLEIRKISTPIMAMS